MIYKIETYVDDEDKQVIAKSPQQTGTDLLLKTEYIGTATINTNVGTMPVQFSFPDDYTLEACFENFEQIADEEITKMIEEAKDQNRIITPDQLRNQQ